MSYVHSWSENWACVDALFLKLAFGVPPLLNVFANPFINSSVSLHSQVLSSAHKYDRQI